MTRLLGAAIAVAVGAMLATTVAFVTITNQHPDSPQETAQGEVQGPQPVTEKTLVGRHYGRR